MPVAIQPNDPPGFWPDPAKRPTFGNDIALANAVLRKTATVRDAIYTGLIPPSTYAQGGSGKKRVYRQIDLRRHFGLPLTGDVQLTEPLW